MEIFLLVLIILVLTGICDLMVGVANDAVNFVNSAVGARAAKLKTILIIAAFGILVGVTFSSGMMEVARKGVFHPEKFTMPELLYLFLAVMLTDVIILDIFNTFGLLTSTTVSLVFELLGAAVSISMIKVYKSGLDLTNIKYYINTSNALTIILGIFLSIIIAFTVSYFVQFFARLIFTFDYEKRIKRYGAIWGGIATSVLVYFILIQGVKGSAVIPLEWQSWIQKNPAWVLGISFFLSYIPLQFLTFFKNINIMKGIVLLGTFALALAFAANDLVNFIGVPFAGISAYTIALQSPNPTELDMSGLAGKIPIHPLYLILAGSIMMTTLFLSKKARSVTQTSVDLGRQDEGMERFESSAAARAVVRFFSNTVGFVKKIVPNSMQRLVATRFDDSKIMHSGKPNPAHFDLVRASVSLVVASALISLGTAHKLPLSTTFVTFMAAMGASLADRAWGRDSAVYRVNGVMMVVGGWFITAIVAFSISFLFALLLYTGGPAAILILSALVIFSFYRTHCIHKEREKEKEELEFIVLKHVDDIKLAKSTAFDHASRFLSLVSQTIGNSYDGLQQYRLDTLRNNTRKCKLIQNTADVIAANIFKTLRMSHLDENHTQHYSQAVVSFQEMAERAYDIHNRALYHVSNNHSQLLPDQIQELAQVHSKIQEMMNLASSLLKNQEMDKGDSLQSMKDEVEKLKNEFLLNQARRIQERMTKTRLSILFYSLLADFVKISVKITRIVSVFQDIKQAKQ